MPRRCGPDRDAAGGSHRLGARTWPAGGAAGAGGRRGDAAVAGTGSADGQRPGHIGAGRAGRRGGSLRGPRRGRRGGDRGAGPPRGADRRGRAGRRGVAPGVRVGGRGVGGDARRPGRPGAERRHRTGTGHGRDDCSPVGHDVRGQYQGALPGAAAALPVLQPGSTIVFISSAASLRAATGIPAYDASKAALPGVCRQVAREGMARGIRANLVVPSLVDTPLGREASRLNPGRTARSLPFGRQATAWRWPTPRCGCCRENPATSTRIRWSSTAARPASGNRPAERYRADRTVTRMRVMRESRGVVTIFIWTCP